jgi:hypothetical protein
VACRDPTPRPQAPSPEIRARSSERARAGAGSSALALLVGAFVPASRSTGSIVRDIAAMRAARERETVVVYRYTEFALKASREGYRGIAYLFTAFAASEGIHARNFERILSRLDAEAAPIPKPEVRLGTTRENLILAVDDEIDSIEDFYRSCSKRSSPRATGTR